MIPVYVVTAVIGGMLVLYSVFGGVEHGHDADHDTDHDSDHDHDSGGGHEVWIPFFSLRFWTYALTFFGITGLLLTQFSDIGALMTAWASGGTGFVAGLGVAYLIHIAKKTEATSGADETDLMGTEGKVLVAIRDGVPGKIRCNLKGELLDLVAMTDDGSELEVGNRAMVVGIEQERVRVIQIATNFEESQSVQTK